MTNDELRQLCESTARTAEANAQGVAAVAQSLNAFIRRTDEVLARQTDISDDQGGDLAKLSTDQRTNDAQITALIGAANADRQEFREQSEADRQAFKEALEADRAEWQKAMASDRAEWQESFNAQQEILQRLLLEIRSTNGEVKQLGDRVNDLEAS